MRTLSNFQYIKAPTRWQENCSVKSIIGILVATGYASDTKYSLDLILHFN